MFNNDVYSWLRDHAYEWWHDALNIITDDRQSTPNLSQEELAFTILMVFSLFVGNLVIIFTMFKRRPRLFLDKSLFIRETFFGFLFGATLYSFYTQEPLGFYLRNGIYLGLLIGGLLTILSTIRENTMDDEEFEKDYIDNAIERKFNGNSRKSKT